MHKEISEGNQAQVVDVGAISGVAWLNILHLQGEPVRSAEAIEIIARLRAGHQAELQRLAQQRTQR